MLTAALVALAFGFASGLFLGVFGLIAGLVAALVVIAVTGLATQGWTWWLLLDLLSAAAALQIGYAGGLVTQAVAVKRGWRRPQLPPKHQERLDD